jgi:hypothetical protein
MKRVPIHTPAAPRASAATSPRPSAMPPAATTSRGATASTTAGISTRPATRPVWPGARIAEASDQDGYAFVQDDVDPAPGRIGEPLAVLAARADRGEEDVHPERPVGQLAHAADLRAELRRRAVGGRDDAEPTRRGDGRRQVRSRHEGHAGLTDRVANAQQVAQRRVQGAARRRGPAARGGPSL